MNAMAMHGMDERIWADPVEVDFSRLHRTLGGHSGIGTFSIGAHKCPGERLARSEIIILLEEWTRRIPAMRMKPTTTQRGMSGAVSGLTEMQVE